jgi:hypothetical protein
MTPGVQDAYTDRIKGGLVTARRRGIPGDVGSVVLQIAEKAFACAKGSKSVANGGLSIARLEGR